MLYFAGIGISGANSISIELKDLLASCDIAYLEQFTSPISDEELEKIREMTLRGEFKIAKRWFVEDGNEILQKAKEKIVVLLSYGDPFIATTHIELRTRAIQEKINTKSIHGASAITAMVGECGLHYYKVGRITTIMEEERLLSNQYYILYKNLIEGNHTILLLEYNQDSGFFLSPHKALEKMIETERAEKRKVITNDSFVIVASRIGFEDQAITAGKISSMMDHDFGAPPHTIVVPGRLHFTEVDAIKANTEMTEEPIDNSKNTPKISRQMLEKYVPMVNEALEEITPHYKDSKEFMIVLENAQHYINDAQRFLDEGRDEVAILCIGYADGLVDALRMAKGIEPKM